MNYANIESQIQEHADSLLFNVSRQPIHLPNGNIIEDKVAIMNEATQQSIAVVSPKYKVVTNGEAMGSTLASFKEAQIDCTDAKLSVETAYNGSRAMVRFDLPAYSVFTGEANETSLSLIVMNSYDGSWKYLTKAGGVRLACLNGQVLGKMIGEMSFSHRSSLDTDYAAQRITKMVSDFGRSEEWFLSMIENKVSNKQIDRAFARFLAITIDDLPKSRVAVHLRERFDKYEQEMGKNAYALYNCLTDWITHRKRKEENGVASKVYDEEQLDKVLTLPSFN